MQNTNTISSIEQSSFDDQKEEPSDPDNINSTLEEIRASDDDSSIEIVESVNEPNKHETEAVNFEWNLPRMLK